MTARISISHGAFSHHDSFPSSNRMVIMPQICQRKECGRPAAWTNSPVDG